MKTFAITFAIKSIQLYQKSISKILHTTFGSSFVGCRFYPNCSEYSQEAFSRFGLIKGFSKSVWRILRCNPFSKGGVDFT